jgi:hypothetical protein
MIWNRDTYVLDTTQKEQELTKIAANEDRKPPPLLGHGTAGQALAFCYLSWTMGGISLTQLPNRQARGRRSGSWVGSLLFKLRFDVEKQQPSGEP